MPLRPFFKDSAWREFAGAKVLKKWQIHFILAQFLHLLMPNLLLKGRNVAFFFEYSNKILNFAARIKGSNNMATPVKIIPTLHGEAARAFIERAEERERNPHPTPIYTESEKKAYYRMLEESGMPL